VEAVVVAEKKYSVWELAEVLATGQVARALKFVDQLLRDGEEPPQLVGAMAWMFRKLLEARELGRGASAGQAAGRLGMRPDAAQMAVRQAQKIPRRRLVNGLKTLYEADSRLKSGTKDERAVMEFLVAQLAGGREEAAGSA
jgi:DNA polymerase-3 subunit delta